MSAILREEPPDLSETNQRISPALERLVNHCLEKNPEERFHSARDLAFALEALSGSTSVVTQPALLAAPAASHWIRKHALVGWIVAAVALIVAALALAFAYFRVPAITEVAKTTFYLSAPENIRFSGANDFISPDGRRIVFSAEDKEGKRQLWIRPLDSLEAQLLPGTDDAIQAFWSPDSRFIGFFSTNKLKKIEASGGPAQTLADAVGRSGTWNRDGIIIYGAGVAGGLFRISSAGGAPTQVTSLDTARNETSHAWPQFLPDGRHFIYLARSALREQSTIRVGSVDGSESRIVISADSTPRYASGYLLFLRERALMAQPFDPDKLVVTADAFPIAQEVGYNPGNGRAFFSVSDNGVLVYRTRVFADSQLAWFDRSGKQTGLVGTPGQLASFDLSPDDKRVIASRLDNQSGATDLWVIDQDRQTRFTFDPAQDQSPVWSPDGAQIVFNSSRSGTFDLYVKPASGARTEELLYKSSNTKGPHDWSRDGKYVVYGDLDSKTSVDLWVLPLFGERKPFVFLQTPYSEDQSQFSPNGKWIAYRSNESGPFQVYVRPFPSVGGQYMVSTNGGSSPRWSANGKELFYVSGDRKLMVVDVKEDGSTLTLGTPRPLFELRPVVLLPGARQYDVTGDGQHFLVMVPLEESSPTPLTVVMNWTAGLKK